MWLRSIRPRWLRERLFWWCVNKRQFGETHFQNVPLEFCPEARMDLTVECVSHRQIALIGYVESKLSKMVVDLARSRGGLLVDVGANWGYFTCLWGASSPKARAVAFEPSPRNFPGLLQNIQRNNLAGRVRAAQMAAGQVAGELSFNLGPEGQTGWGGFAEKGSEGQMTVPVTTLDKEFGGGAEEIEALKIDTEGADYWVIEGAAAMLSQHRIKHIFFEADPERMEALGVSGTRAIDLLRECGYKLEGGAKAWHASAPKAE